ncbi:hypothetical protein NL676_007912 [Syzygium grande]|nr:hypothetical protein NL676_007912 [Syzygium grande]
MEAFQISDPVSRVFESSTHDHPIHVWDATTRQELLGKLRGVPTITIGGWCLQTLSLLEMEGVPSPLSKCQNLILCGSVGKWDLPGIAYMLRSSPCLEKLVIHLAEFPLLKFELDGESKGFKPSRRLPPTTARRPSLPAVLCLPSPLAVLRHPKVEIPPSPSPPPPRSSQPTQIRGQIWARKLPPPSLLFLLGFSGLTAELPVHLARVVPRSSSTIALEDQTRSKFRIIYGRPAEARRRKGP